MGRRFVACSVASGSSHAMRSDDRGSKMTAGERWSMWCRSKKLLLLKTDQTPLVSARSCVATLASQASSFHVRFAPDSDGNADIAEGPSWANRRHLRRSKFGAVKRANPSRKLRVGHCRRISARPQTIKTAAAARAVRNGSLRTMTAIMTPNRTLVSRRLATMAMGASVIAQSTMP